MLLEARCVVSVLDVIEMSGVKSVFYWFVELVYLRLAELVQAYSFFQKAFFSMFNCGFLFLGFGLVCVQFHF